MKEPFIPILNGEIFNTKAGFKLIYNTMLGTKDFNKALRIIFRVRYTNIVTIENIITIIKARYDKEKYDYIHAVLDNNINN